MPATSLFFLKPPTAKAIGPLAATKPTKYMYRNPGGTIIVPRLVPAKYPMPHPIAVQVNPIHGPRRMHTANIITGAKLMVESGGGRVSQE